MVNAPGWAAADAGAAARAVRLSVRLPTAGARPACLRTVRPLTARLRAV